MHAFEQIAKEQGWSLQTQRDLLWEFLLEFDVETGGILSEDLAYFARGKQNFENCQEN